MVAVKGNGLNCSTYWCLLVPSPCSSGPTSLRGYSSSGGYGSNGDEPTEVRRSRSQRGWRRWGHGVSRQQL